MPGGVHRGRCVIDRVAAGGTRSQSCRTGAAVGDEPAVDRRDRDVVEPQRHTVHPGPHLQRRRRDAARFEGGGGARADVVRVGRERPRLAGRSGDDELHVIGAGTRLEHHRQRHRRGQRSEHDEDRRAAVRRRGQPDDDGRRAGRVSRRRRARLRPPQGSTRRRCTSRAGCSRARVAYRTATSSRRAGGTDAATPIPHAPSATEGSQPPSSGTTTWTARRRGRPGTSRVPHR